MNGQIRTPASGRHQQKGARVKAGMISALIPSPYGVKSTKHMVTQLIGVMRTQIEQADHPVITKACGATPAIDPVIYLPHAMQLQSALKEKGKEE